MTETTPRRPVLVMAVGGLVVLYAKTFLLGALLHLGVQIPIGSLVLEEPRILPATIVEGLCGLVLAGSGSVVFAR